jgi:SpoU rRNA methylase family enzyme
MMQPNLHDAVRVVYTNAAFVYGNDVNSLKVLHVNKNPITIVPETVTAELSKLQANYTAEQTAQTNAKASAIAKLTALGLTQAEVSAILGA